MPINIEKDNSISISGFSEGMGQSPMSDFSDGRVLQGELKTFQTTDRACLALLDDKVRENGVQIDNNLWESLPKNNF